MELCICFWSAAFPAEDMRRGRRSTSPIIDYITSPPIMIIALAG
jgi:hypothetical protein